jgi:hypothetical protein
MVRLARELSAREERLSEMAQQIEDTASRRQHEIEIELSRHAEALAAREEAVARDEHSVARHEEAVKTRESNLTKRDLALEEREEIVARGMREVDAARYEAESLARQRDELAGERHAIQSAGAALHALEGAIHAREAALARKEEEISVRLREVRDGEEALGIMEVRRMQLQAAITDLSAKQREEENAEAARRRARLDLEGLQREVTLREEGLREREERLRQRTEELREEEARMHELRASAALAAAKDKEVFEEAKEEMSRRMAELASHASDLEAQSKALHVREKEFAATFARVEAKERALAVQEHVQPHHRLHGHDAPLPTPHKLALPNDYQAASIQDLAMQYHDARPLATQHFPARHHLASSQHFGMESDGNSTSNAITSTEYTRNLDAASRANLVHARRSHSTYEAGGGGRSDGSVVTIERASRSHASPPDPTSASHAPASFPRTPPLTHTWALGIDSTGKQRGMVVTPISQATSSRLDTHTHKEPDKHTDKGLRQSLSSRPLSKEVLGNVHVTEAQMHDMDAKYLVQTHLRERLGAVEEQAAQVKKREAKVSSPTHTYIVVSGKLSLNFLFVHN